MKEKGNSIIYIGTNSNPSLFEKNFSELVDLDLRGKTNPDELFALINNHKICGTISYDNFIMHATLLAQKKALLYSFDKKERSRGDIKYIQRNEKQYFWNFNGEFWADELGDYVFALKSEC